MKAINVFILCSLFSILNGCSTYTYESNIARNNAFDTEDDDIGLSPQDRANRVTLEDKRAALKLRTLHEKDKRAAYEAGVRQTLNDFKGRMQAREVFTYEPPMVEYVKMPAQIINGQLRPSRIEPVLISPARVIENNGILLPESNR